MRLIDADVLRRRMYILYAGNAEKWREEREKHTDTLLKQGAFKEAIESEKRQTALKVIGSALRLVRNMETVEVSAEPKKGKWLPDKWGFWKCSACGFPSEAHAANVLYKFCPVCGAKMEGEENEAD